jgi:hypothetical protein
MSIICFPKKMHKGNKFENPNMCNSPYFKFLSKCFQKFANKNMWSFYYFSKKPLPNFIIFGPHLIHQMMQTSAVLKFPRKPPKPRGISAKWLLSSSSSQASTCVEDSWTLHGHLLLAASKPRRPPGACTWTPPLPPFSLTALLFPPLSLVLALPLLPQ